MARRDILTKLGMAIEKAEHKAGRAFDNNELFVYKMGFLDGVDSQINETMRIIKKGKK